MGPREEELASRKEARMNEIHLISRSYGTPISKSEKGNVDDQMKMESDCYQDYYDTIQDYYDTLVNKEDYEIRLYKQTILYKQTNGHSDNEIDSDSDNEINPYYEINPSYRILSYGRDSCTIPFCSLERLVYDIGVGYSELSDLFPELTINEVRSIQTRILMGTYKLSEVKLNVFMDKDDPQPVKYNHIMLVKNRNCPKYLAFSSVPEDRLVLMALGRMVNLSILETDYMLENSYGFKVDWYHYYEHIVCGREKALRVYIIDLSTSIKILDMDHLLWKLSFIVQDEKIMELLYSFLNLPVQDATGLDYSSNYFMKIPSTVFLTDVLFNLALSECDFWFQRLFRELNYTRFLHEIIVTFPSSKEPKMSIDKFEKQLVKLLETCQLSGKIWMLCPGDRPVPCYGGHICVSQEGLIQVMKKKPE